MCLDYDNITSWTIKYRVFLSPICMMHKMSNMRQTNNLVWLKIPIHAKRDPFHSLSLISSSRILPLIYLSLSLISSVPTMLFQILTVFFVLPFACSLACWEGMQPTACTHTRYFDFIFLLYWSPFHHNFVPSLNFFRLVCHLDGGTGRSGCGPCPPNVPAPDCYMCHTDFCNGYVNLRSNSVISRQLISHFLQSSTNFPENYNRKWSLFPPTALSNPLSPFRNVTRIVGNYRELEANCTHRLVDTVSSIEESNPFGYISLALGIVATLELFLLMALLGYLRFKREPKKDPPRGVVSSPMYSFPLPNSALTPVPEVLREDLIDLPRPKCHTIF